MLLSMDEFRAFEPKKTTYALFGWPLGHTMSPELHAQLFEASGQDADYIGVAVPPEDLPEAFELAKRKLGGINCTIPHKKAVIPLLDEIDTALEILIHNAILMFDTLYLQSLSYKRIMFILTTVLISVIVVTLLLYRYVLSKREVEAEYC